MSRSARVALIAAGCALVAIAAAVWMSGVRAPTPGTLDPATDSASATRARTLALESVEDPVAPPAEHAERTVPAAAAEATPVLDAARATLVVRVTAVETGAPAANVRISARGEPDPLWHREDPRTTGEDGVEEFEVRAGTDLVVRAGGDKYRTSAAEVRVPALAPGERREVAIAVQVDEDTVVHGVVLRSDTREGVAGVVVETVPLSPMAEGVQTITANDGTFRLALRSYATQALAYSHPQFGTARSRFDGHESPADPLVVLLDAGASIVANVIDVDGEPTKWWTVAATEIDSALLDSGQTSSRSGLLRALSSPRTTTEVSATVAEDSAELGGLKAGRPLTLEVRRGDRVVWHSRAPVVLAPGERRAVTIRIGGASLSGFVRDASGQPQAGIGLIFRPEDRDDPGYSGASAMQAEARTAADGAYRIAGLEPGAWLVEASTRIEGGFVRLDRKESNRILERVVLRGGPQSLDIVIARGLRIAGRVLGADGVGVEGATVSARAGSDAARSEARSGTDGAFELDVPRAGTWTVEATAAGGGTYAPVVVEAGARDVVLHLEPCARLELELVDGSDKPVDPDWVLLVRAGGIPEFHLSGLERTGFWSVDCLRPRTLDVVVTTADGLYAMRRDLALAAGSTTSAKIVLSPGGEVRVRFDGPGDTASLQVLDRGLLIRRATILRGVSIGTLGPRGEVELQLTVGGRRHDRKLDLAREHAAEIVFDGGWR